MLQTRGLEQKGGPWSGQASYRRATWSQMARPTILSATTTGVTWYSPRSSRKRRSRRRRHLSLTGGVATTVGVGAGRSVGMEPIRPRTFSISISDTIIWSAFEFERDSQSWGHAILVYRSRIPASLYVRRIRRLWS